MRWWQVLSVLALGCLAAPGCGGAADSLAAAVTPPPALAFTEVHPASGWIEVHNPGADPVDLSTTVLEIRGAPRWPLPVASLAPGETRAFTPGFAFPAAGEAKLLGLHRHLLAQVTWSGLPMAGASYGRTSRGHWQSLTAPTPGTENTDPSFPVVINELCADNEEHFENPDEPGSFDDWIELYNPTEEALALGGFTLTDDAADPAKWTVPPGTQIPAGGYLLIHADGEPGRGGTHADFKLDNDGEAVLLFDPEGALVDCVAFGEQDDDRSHGRLTDGAASWATFRTPTPGRANTDGVVDIQAEPSHGKRDPDYAYIYDTTIIRRLDIELSESSMRGLRDELDENFPLPYNERDFDYVDGTVRCEGETWHHVGVRYKGNGSLSPYGWGALKLSLKLDFDEFEDDFPETKNQRFYGVKKLILNNAFRDPTLLRELLCYEALRELGAHASRIAVMRVYVNGEYWGLHISVEQVDGRFLKDRFGDDDGNLYKPEGEGGQLTHFVEETFEKKSNEDEEDWSDIQDLIDLVNDPASDLFAVLDVDSFLTALAVNTVLSNFDNFANTDHNYYLYNDPETGLWRFIPWDHTEAFGLFHRGGFTPETVHTYPVFDPVIGTNTLIDRLLVDPTHRARYAALVQQVLDGPLAAERLDARMDDWHDLMRPYVLGPLGESWPHTLLEHPSHFDLGLDVSLFEGPARVLGLREFMTLRRPVVQAALNDE